MTNSQDFLSCIEGHACVIELHRARALNSLNLGMIHKIDAALDVFESDDEIAVVTVASSAPRAFCAGGDVRWVREEDLSGDFSAGDQFFEEEYALNLRMSEYPKPIVALLEGIVMGGGFGLSVHGSHRVVTPQTVGAMPEMAIGFVPDVGMSHVLTHLPVEPEIGAFIGLTGWRLSPADMMYTGLATHHVEDVEGLSNALRNTELMQALQDYSTPVQDPSELEENAEEIKAAFAHNTWSEVEKALGAFSDLLESANPSSLIAGFELFKRSAVTDLRTALDNELRVGKELRRQPNFAEGVRAVLVDKDRNANFEPTQLDPVFWRNLLT